MVQYEIYTGTLKQLSTFYDEWDIDNCDDRLTDWHACTNRDKGKFIKFDDGSELYAEIYLVGKDYIRTSAGVHRVKDIVHCSKPKYKHWGYSGANANEESFNVRPPSKNEKAKAHRMIMGHKPRTMTRRVRMLVLDDLKKEAEDNGADASYVMKRLKHWSDGDGQHAYKSLVTQARIQGIEIEKPLDKVNGEIGLSIAHQLGFTGTIQDARKGKKEMSLKELKKLSAAEVTEATIVESNKAVDKC